MLMLNHCILGAVWNCVAKDQNQKNVFLMTLLQHHFALCLLLPHCALCVIQVTSPVLAKQPAVLNQVSSFLL